MKIIRQALSILLKAGISIAILWYLFRQVDERSLLEIIRNSNKLLLLLGFVIFLAMYLTTLFRWKMLLDAVDIKLPFKRIVISFSGGVFFNLFLPSTIGGDFVRSVDLASHTKRMREVVATVVLDRLSGYVGLVVTALCALILGWNLVADKSVLLCMFILTGILVLILLFLFNKQAYLLVNRILKSPNAGRIRAGLINLHHEIYLFRKMKRMLFANVLLSILGQVMGPLSFFVIGRALGINVSIIYFFVFLPIIGAITLLPISIGGLGLRDATMIYFFAKAGVAKNSAFAMSLLNFSFILACGIIGGLIYVFTVHHRRLQPNKTSTPGSSR